MQKPVFECRNVAKRFGDFVALHDVSLMVGAGERVALVGPSGAGKSTLINLLNGSLLPDAGKVNLFGQNVIDLSNHALRDVQRRIGTVYQQFNLVDNLRVIHNVNAGHLGRWSWWKAVVSLMRPLQIQTAHEALQQVGIPEKLYERTDQLSGGQQQRVALARVLVQNPDVILADEPIASLDPERSREVMQILVNLAKQHQKTLVVSIHAVEFSLSYLDRIIGIQQGRILFDKPSEQVTDGMLAQLYQLQ